MDGRQDESRTSDGFQASSGSSSGFSLSRFRGSLDLFVLRPAEQLRAVKDAEQFHFLFGKFRGCRPGIPMLRLPPRGLSFDLAIKRTHGLGM